MDYKKFKSLVVLSTIIFSSLVLLSWSQTWFLFSGQLLATGNVVSVSGQEAAPALAALSLLNFALTAALALAGRLMRKVLSLVLCLSSIAIVWISIAAFSQPLVSSISLLTEISGLSDPASLSGLVETTEVTLWVYLAPISGFVLIITGIVSFFTSAKWASNTRKYDRTVSADAQKIPSGELIDQWDALSAGEDPTTN